MKNSNTSFVNGTELTVQDSLGALASNSIDSAGEKVEMLVSGKETLGRFIKKPTPGKFFSLFLLVPAVIAFGISTYLAYASFTSSEVLGCSSGAVFDCSSVLHSKYAKFLGVPVSLLAALNYLGMLSALSMVLFMAKGGRVEKYSWTFIAFAGISAGLAAVWFISLQAFVLNHFCPWCLGAHACGLVIATALLIRKPVGAKLMLAGAGMASAAVSGLVLGQVLATEPPKFKITEFSAAPTQQENDSESDMSDDVFAPPMDESGNLFEAPFDDEDIEPSDPQAAHKLDSLKTSLVLSLSSLLQPTAMITWQEEGESKQEEKKPGKVAKTEKTETTKQEKVERRAISIQGNVKLDPKQWPLLGSPNAKHIFVEMFDYACPHCRATHSAIKGAFESMGDDVALIVLPVPLNSACNNTVTVTGAKFVESCQTSKLAVAVWRLDSAKFEEFHNWMFDGAHAPTYSMAKSKADALVGKEKLDAELRKQAPGKYVSKHVELYKRAGRGVVPKLLFPTTTIEGEFTSAQSLVNMIRDRATEAP